MRADVKRDLGDSAYDFKRVVWSAIASICGGGNLEPVESVTDIRMARDLDIYAGVDAWQVIRERNVIRGIACRIQWGNPWDTWTVRLDRHDGQDTEYQKRKYALENQDKGYIYPHLAVQAYIEKPRRKGKLLSVGLIETADLFDVIDITRTRINPTDGVEFCWLGFEEAELLGLKVFLKRPLIQKVSVGVPD